MNDPSPGARPPAPRFTDEQQAGLEARRLDHDRTLDAMHGLEAALSSAAPGREPAWLEAVDESLSALDTVIREEQHNGAQPDSLLSDIARTQPRLRNRVRGLRVAYQQLRDAITSSRTELAEDAEPDIAEIRRRLARLLDALRYQRSRESDLLYEAYYEAFHRDLDEDARRQQ